MSEAVQDAQSTTSKSQKSDADKFEFTPLNPDDFAKRYTDQDAEFVKVKNLVHCVK